MKSLSFLSLTLSLLPLITALPSSTHVTHESRHPSSISPAWTLLAPAPRTLSLPVRIALKQANLDRLHDELLAVSSPSSERYGQHWTEEQVKEFFMPSAETREAVHGWLEDAGFEVLGNGRGGGWVEVNMTVAQAEHLLKTDYHVYEHESGMKHIACHSYSVPAHIRDHIDFITPTIHFDAMPRSPSASPQELQRRQAPPNLHGLGQPGELSSGLGPKISPEGFFPIDILSLLFGPSWKELKTCDKMITPACLRALYTLPSSGLLSSTPAFKYGAKKNSYGIVEYTPQAYSAHDLDLFFANYSKELVGTRPKTVSIDGGIVQTSMTGLNFNAESNLDLAYAMALLGREQEVTLYQVGDIVESASFNNFLDALDASYCTYLGGDDKVQDAVYPDTASGGYKKKDCGSVSKAANIISTSYGYNEADLSRAYAARQCYEYGKLGMMGVTFIYSSGDNGVAGNGGTCLNPDGSQTVDGKRFNPTFPGGCPYVTSVGATQINEGKSVFDEESACERVIYSGGGFSNYFEAPDYQKAALDHYFKEHNPPYGADRYNNSRTSRGFPDISANGANYVLSVSNHTGLVYGTSASAPVVGAILTLVNDVRLAAGKGPIGFINPVLYEKFADGEGLKDITSGGNQGCGTAGFTAVEGWDPVTGLGTPNFPALLTEWLGLP